MCTIVLGKSGQLACHSPPSPSLQHVSSYNITCGCCYAFPCVMTFSFTLPKLNKFHCSVVSSRLQIGFFYPHHLFVFLLVNFLFLLIPPSPKLSLFPFPFFAFTFSHIFSFMSCFLFFLQKQPVSTSSAWMHLPWIWQRVFLLSDAQLISWMWVFS